MNPLFALLDVYIQRDAGVGAPAASPTLGDWGRSLGKFRRAAEQRASHLLDDSPRAHQDNDTLSGTRAPTPAPTLSLSPSHNQFAHGQQDTVTPRHGYIYQIAIGTACPSFPRRPRGSPQSCQCRGKEVQDGHRGTSCQGDSIVALGSLPRRS
jgi:hypothetical protein